MHVFAIIIGKILSFFLTFIHRGGSLPGKIALKIDKNILDYFKMPNIVIGVTGSSGKTSTSYLIAEALKKNGYTVAHNTSGANLTPGLTTLLIKNSKLNGKINKQAVVFEIDERYTKKLVHEFHTTHLIVTNITRDQPPRHGHYEIVYNSIKSAFNKNMTIIVNGDDPLATKLSLEHEGKVIYFGMANHKGTIPYPKTNALDFIYCPKCHTKLEYDYVSFSNVGNYHCPNGDYNRPHINYEITNVGNNLTINNEYKVKPNTDIDYTYYNIVAAYATLACLGIDENGISNSLSDVKLSEKRYNYIEYDGRDCYILSGKNENAPSYNQAVNYVAKDMNLKTIMFGFEYISLRYPHQDVSWLYDIDFELLKDKTINAFICIGPFAYDIATRIKLAGINPKKIKICSDIYSINLYLNRTKGKIYGILNLGTDKKISKIVGEK